MPDELEWRPSSMAFFLEGRSWPFTSPLHLLRFGPLSPPARIRMGLAVLKLQKTAHEVGPFESITARDWIRRNDGRAAVREDLGPAAARQVRGPRRRHLDGVAVGQAHDAPQARGQGGAPGAARLPGPQLGAAVPRAADADRGRRRARADRPARGADRPAPRRLRRHRRRARLVPARPRPAGVRARRHRDLRRGRRDRAERRLRAHARPAAARRLPRADAQHRVPHRALPPARARPAVQPVLLDQHRRPGAARSSAWSSTPTSSSPSATTAGASSTSPTTSRPATRCWSSTPSS